MGGNKPILEEYKINIRIQLASLWSSVMFCYLYGDYFELYVPGKVEGLLNGNNMLNSPEKLLLATFILTIPALMIFLTLILKAILTKWLNIGVGIFFTLFTLMVGISSISQWHTFYVFLSFLESIITLMIVIKAFNWSKSKEGKLQL